MAVILVFAIGLLEGCTSVMGARVRLNAGETAAPDSASALVETNLEGGCSLHHVKAAKQALWKGLVPALKKIKGMEKVENTWSVRLLWYQSKTAFDKACTSAMRAKCKGMAKVCVNYDGPGGYQTNGHCVKDGELGTESYHLRVDHGITTKGQPVVISAHEAEAEEYFKENLAFTPVLLETEAGEAEAAIQDRQGQSLESGSSAACPTSLSTAEAYLRDLIPSLKKLSGFGQVDGTWSIKKLLALANKLDDNTCKNPVNAQKCRKQGKDCVNVDGPGGYLTSHACMACGEWGNPNC